MDHYDFYEPYEYSSPYLESTLIGVIMIFIIVMLVCAIFALVSYILRGVGMYTIAKRQGMDYAWLAFIPFARTYLHGELAGNIRLKHKSIQNPGIWLLALPFLYGAVSSLMNGILWFVGFGSITKAFTYAFIPYGRMDISVGSLMGMVILFVVITLVSVVYTALYKAFQVLVDHQILERFTSKNMSIAHAVLSTLLPMYGSICIFVMRNRPFNPGMEPPASKPFMQSPPPGTYYGTSVPPEPPVSPLGGGYYGNTSAASDFENRGSILESTDSENRRSILEPTDAGSSGSILEPTDSEKGGSILGTSGEISEESAKNEEVVNSENTSSVNFTLLDDEHKEL